MVPVDDASAAAEGYSALPHQQLADKLAGTETVVEGVDREKVVGDAQRQLVASVVAAGCATVADAAVAVVDVVVG